MKRFFLLSAVTLLSVQFALAQPGGSMRRTVEERVKVVHDKLDSAFKPAADVMSQLDTVFTTYYKAQDKMREEMQAGGERPDREVMREKMQGMLTERDDKLKKILTEAQFKTFKTDIEPSMRGGRGAGRGGNGGGGQ